MSNVRKFPDISQHGKHSNMLTIIITFQKNCGGFFTVHQTLSYCAMHFKLSRHSWSNVGDKHDK